MKAICEQPERINDAADYPIQFQCGCEVVFLGSCFHRSSRMTCCNKHNRRRDFEARNKIQRQAKEHLRFAKLMQPPR